MVHELAESAGSQQLLLMPVCLVLEVLLLRNLLLEPSCALQFHVALFVLRGSQQL